MKFKIGKKTRRELLELIIDLQQENRNLKDRLKTSSNTDYVKCSHKKINFPVNKDGLPECENCGKKFGAGL